MTIAEKLWANTDKSADCWVWTKAKTAAGYGVIWFDRKLRLAHRVSWEIDNGATVPPGMYICHHCDNPACVRPDHLFLGTPTDNAKDMVKKGRNKTNVTLRQNHMVARGEANPTAKLTEADVRLIRARAAAGGWGIKRSLAKEYGVHESCIGLIVKRQNWAHIL